MIDNLSFYQGKRVLVTGHTGFKGTWLCQLLRMAGAEVSGYALAAPTTPNLFEICGMERQLSSNEGDIRDRERLKRVFDEARPEIVFHLAAQPIVRDSYRDPVYTYETNVMGTVNLLECVRTAEVPPRSVVNITTDKVYQNREWVWGYRENEPLDGFDPYSNSKSCSELATHSYRSSFFPNNEVAISTARAGNVIGGGDFASDRIIPDCVRAVQAGRAILVRNPQSVRPYQHVLEPLYAYLLIAQRQYENSGLADYYNVGPDECDCITTRTLVETFCSKWGKGAVWEAQPDHGPHEAGYLKLDCAKIKSVFDWKPRWRVETAIEKTVEWTKSYFNGQDVTACMEEQIREFLDGESKHV